MKNAKISIITICYNADNLERTCESIVTQDRDDFEWVVIDGGSSDEHQKIFDKYKSRMDYFVSEPDKGIYDAMNKGILAATGEYVIFMNAGDSFYDTNILSHVMRFMETDDSDIIYGIAKCDNDKKNEKQMIRIHSREITDRFWFDACPPHQAMFYKRKCFMDIGLYRTDYRIFSDKVQNTIFYRAGAKYSFIDRVIANFDTSGVSQDKFNARQIVEKMLSQHEFFPELLTRFDIYHLSLCNILFRLLRTVYCFDKTKRKQFSIRYKNISRLIKRKRYVSNAEFYRVLKEYPHILNPR